MKKETGLQIKKIIKKDVAPALRLKILIRKNRRSMAETSWCYASCKMEPINSPFTPLAVALTFTITSLNTFCCAGVMAIDTLTRHNLHM